MKVFCFNAEDCSYFEQIPYDRIDEYNLNKPFIRCPECNSLAIVVKDDFDLNSINEATILSSLLKLSKRE